MKCPTASCLLQISSILDMLTNFVAVLFYLFHSLHPLLMIIDHRKFYSIRFRCKVSPIGFTLMNIFLHTQYPITAFVTDLLLMLVRSATLPFACSKSSANFSNWFFIALKNPLNAFHELDSNSQPSEQLPKALPLRRPWLIANIKVILTSMGPSAAILDWHIYYCLITLVWCRYWA